MKQLVQSMRQGTVDVLDVPSPQLREGGVLVRTAASLLSAGTERAALDFAKRSLIDKARSRPDLVKQVVQKARRDGMTQALSVALSRLDRPMAPGYACAGTVIETDLAEFAVGDRVACAGAGYATHAEINFIPKNLTVPIPKRPSGEWVGFDEAAFTTLGAIALHGVRLGQPQLGDKAVVIGLGAIGLLCVQILRAHGCRVAGVDLNATRCDHARALGADIATTPADIGPTVKSWTRELGADLVLVAAASQGNEPAVLAADLSRDKGRIVAVGATGMDIPRRTLFQKEVSVVVSRSYGPGRYDPDYEERGHDYPLPYVRWTERENMRAFLDLVADDRVDVRTLISHRFSISEAERAYAVLESQSVLGLLLEYPQTADARSITRVDLSGASAGKGSEPRTRAAVSFVGAGNFARAVLLPAFKGLPDTSLRGVVAASGVSARSAADRFHFKYCSTTASDVWNDSDCNAVVIATRHDAHASLVCEGLQSNKAVFVEKPLCLSENELHQIESLLRSLQVAERSPFLMVGFNRRFAPAVDFVKSHFANVHGPVNVIYRVNAGRVPVGSWVISATEGGGRILGEVCHFVDLCAYLADSPIKQVSAVRSSGNPDDVIVTLRMGNGSIASVAYLVDGDPSSSKERIEIYGGGATGVIEDFRSAVVIAGGRKKRLGGRFARQDKGHRAEMAAFVKGVATGTAPISLESSLNATRATFAILASLEFGGSVEISA
jgi:polar amino acid transport system substrate-binding protein